MLPLQTRQQKIYVTCLVKRNGRILLLRGSQYTDQASSATIGYFGLPRFTLRFGANPTEVIKRELEKQFNQPVETVSVMGVTERMTDSHTQAVELVYQVAITAPAESQRGRFLFASIDELEQYVMPAELKQLLQWLGE